MKNQEEEPKEYFERNIPLVIIVAVSGVLLDWISVSLLIDVSPWGTATAVPGLILTLQGLWLIVNPYAIVYKDRFEIKQTLMYNKEFYYLDAKAIDVKKTHSIQLIYNDGDLERLPLIGMRASHKQKFKDRLTEKLNESVKHRDF